MRPTGEMVRALNGLPIIIRTLDIGGDKEVPYLNLPAEDNSFLGDARHPPVPDPGGPLPSPVAGHLPGGAGWPGENHVPDDLDL